MFSSALSITAQALVHNWSIDFCIIIYVCKHKIVSDVLFLFKVLSLIEKVQKCGTKKQKQCPPHKEVSI